jgi:transposase
MSNKVIAMQLIRSLIQFLEKGFSFRQISRELRLSRKTVTLYATRLKNSAYSLMELRHLDDAVLSSLVYTAAPAVPSLISADPRRQNFVGRIDYFLAELKRTGVTCLLLWEEYRRENPQGYSYTQFCVLLRQYQKTQAVSMHFMYKPAEVMMVDFAGDKLSYTDKESGEVVSCPVFVCVLPFSGYSYAIALPNASTAQVIKALNGCLQYFEGVPLTLKTDNMKQIVYKACRYEPVFTEVMQQWALHQNITLLAARVGKPKDKAPVENEVKLTYQRIYAPLRDKVFFSLEELNAAIKEQLAVHHRRPFQKKAHSRCDCFNNEEKPLLQPLPPNPYLIRHRVQAKVQKNYHITLGEDWHHYSVPFSCIGKSVSVIYDTDIVEVYYEHHRIALHRRSYKKHGYTTIKEHMPESHQRYREQRGWNAEYFLMQAEKIGPHTHQYIKGALKGKTFTEQTYNGCLGILRLGKAYGTDRLEAACNRALKGQSFNYRTLHNILSNNLDSLQQGSEQPSLFSMPEHGNLRGPEAYH